MSELEIYQFPCRADNYGVLIHDATAGVTASIDAPEAQAVKSALETRGWTLTHIFTTHHHGDHVAGNAALKVEFGCKIIGPRAEAANIPGIDQPVSEGDTFQFGSFEVQVLETPGHTAGHISYILPMAKVAFVGDTLFAMGCGRLFEGTPQMMWASLQKLTALPKDTRVYCGHEYTLASAQFALTIEPDNEDLQNRAARVQTLRKDAKPTLPTTIGEELATNPFLRPDAPSIRERLGLANAADWEVFAEIRKRKDNA